MPQKMDVSWGSNYQRGNLSPPRGQQIQAHLYVFFFLKCICWNPLWAELLPLMFDYWNGSSLLTPFSWIVKLLQVTGLWVHCCQCPMDVTCIVGSMGVSCQLAASRGWFRRCGCQAEEREMHSRRCNRPGDKARTRLNG